MTVIAIAMIIVGALLLMTFFAWSFWGMYQDIGARGVMIVVTVVVSVLAATLLLAFGVSELVT